MHIAMLYCGNMKVDKYTNEETIVDEIITALADKLGWEI